MEISYLEFKNFENSNSESFNTWFFVEYQIAEYFFLIGPR